MDDGCPECAFGWVVGRLDSLMVVKVQTSVAPPSRSPITEHSTTSGSHPTCSASISSTRNWTPSPTARRSIGYRHRFGRRRREGITRTDKASSTAGRQAVPSRGAAPRGGCRWRQDPKPQATKLTSSQDSSRTPSTASGKCIGLSKHSRHASTKSRRIHPRLEAGRARSE